MNKQIQRKEREEQILLSLKKLDYLSRSQLEILHSLKSPRNANRVLSNMSEYLSSFRQENEFIYYLNANGRKVVDSDKARKKTQNVTHFLMRNQLYIEVGRPSTWRNEIKVKINNVHVICDATFNHDGLPVFVEVDNTQTMQKNASKVKRYKQLSEKNPKFYLVWVTTTEYRRKRLEKMCEGLAVKVYTMSDIT